MLSSERKNARQAYEHALGAARWRLLLAGMAMLCACQKDSQQSLGKVDDAIAVRTVQIRPSNEAPAPTLRVSAEPILTIGVAEGQKGHELYQVKAARRFADQRIVVANAGSSELRIYDASGRLTQTMGRRGKGPGEFSSLDWVQVLAGDTLVASDGTLRRLTAFGPDGKVAWTRNLVGHQWLTNLGYPSDVYLGDGGTVLAWDTDDLWSKIKSGAVRPVAVGRSSFVVIHYNDKGIAIDTIGIFPGVEYSVTLSRDGQPRTGVAPLGRSIGFTVTRGRVFVGTQEDFTIREYSPDGKLVTLIRAPSQDLRISANDLAEYKRNLLQIVGDNPPNREKVAQHVAQEAHPPTRPAYGRVLLDSENQLWISKPYNPLATPVEWLVVDLETGRSTELQVPERFHIYEIGKDYVLGRFKDDYGVEYVKLYALTRT